MNHIAVRCGLFSKALAANLKAGLILLLPMRRARLRVSPLLFAAVLLLNTALQIALVWATTEPPRLWWSEALLGDALYLTLLLSAGLVAATVLRCRDLIVHLALALVCVDFWLTLLGTPLYFWRSVDLFETWPWLFTAWWWVLTVWPVLAVFRVLGSVDRRLTPGRLILAVVLVAGVQAPFQYLAVQPYFTTDHSDVEAEAQWVPQFDAEALLSRQSAMVDRALAAAPSSAPGVVDIFAVSFAAYGGQDLFRNEAFLFESRITERFGALTTLHLINHPDLISSVPLATSTNLRQTLSGLAEKAQAEDLLVLYATSHGVPDPAAIYVEMGNLPLHALTPQTVAESLADSPFAQAIVVVSACYSGGFVEPLSQPDIAVVTASAADRPSFGCSDEAEFSYFGEAFLKQALAESDSLTEAFALARSIVAEREAREGHDPSQPQLRVGDGIAGYLREHTPIQP